METGFHSGELLVQARAGVSADARRLAEMLDPPSLSGGFARFLGDRTVAALTARSTDGELWISPLTGPPGVFEVTSPTALTVHAATPPDDPLHELRSGQPVGLVVIEFATRRRVRLNGTLSTTTPGSLHLDVDQAYGNCPQYIHRRRLRPVTASLATTARRVEQLGAPEIALIESADTFFIGTQHPTRGADASHRGGPAGFVRVQDGTLTWPDFPGNNMFNTLGNLAVDPSAALLFSDFATGATVQLTGRAEIDWLRTDRLVRFHPAAIVAGNLLRVRAS